MPINRILKKDLLSKTLQDYSEQIGEATNDPAHRKRLKEFLVSFAHHEEFYTETDLKEHKISWAYGISNWLGYADPDVEAGTTPLDYIANLVHPTLRDWYRFYTNAAIIDFTKRNPEYLKSRFVISMPMKNAAGRYVLVKQMSMPFGKDAQGRITSFINSYSVFGDYRGEPVRLRLYESPQQEADEATRRNIENLLCNCIELRSGKNLTEAHFEIIDAIRTIRQNMEEPNAKKIRQELLRMTVGKKIAEGSVTRYLTDIRTRLENLLKVEQGEKEMNLWYFDNPIQAIDLFDHSGMIDLLRAYERNKEISISQKKGENTDN